MEIKKVNKISIDTAIKKHNVYTNKDDAQNKINPVKKINSEYWGDNGNELEIDLDTGMVWETQKDGSKVGMGVFDEEGIEEIKALNEDKKENNSSNKERQKGNQRIKIDDMEKKEMRKEKKKTTQENDEYIFFFENDEYVGKLIKKNNIYIDLRDKDNIKYKRYNPDDNTYNNISIFDDENIESIQYGADQGDFEDNFDKLIKDDFIWKEMQKYYPVDSFESEDDAMDYYERYFNLIANTGCGYSAAANAIFKQYEGKEEEFEKTFGFPMYTVDNKGNIDFNYEYLQLLYFNYDYAGKYTLEELEKGQDINNYIEDFFRTDAKISAADLETLSGFLKEYGIDCTSKTDSFNSFGFFSNDNSLNDNSNKKFNKNDNVIYGGSGYDLYDMEGKLYKKNGGGHYMLITDYTDDGKPIISSWGKKFILDIKGKETGMLDSYRYSIINFN